MNVCKKLIRGIGLLFFLLLAGLCVQKVRSIIPESGTPSIEEIIRKTEANPLNPHNWYILGSVYAYDLSSSSLEKSIQSFTRAVRLNPWFWKYWSELSLVLENTGHSEEACRMLAVAQRLNSSYVPFYWYAANLYLRNGRFDDAAACFRRYLEGNTGRVTAVLELCWKSFPDSRRIVDDMVPDRMDLLAGALQWSIGKNDDLLSRRCWERMLELGEPLSLSVVFQYCAYQLRRQDYTAASRSWRQGLRRCFPHRLFPEDEPVFNGSFEYTPLGGGFGWLCHRDRGIRWKLDRLHRYRDFHALHFSFDGSRNFSGSVLRQLIFLPDAGTYTLHYAVFSDLTTDQGFYFQVLHHTQYPHATPLAAGDHDAADPVWRTGEVVFTTSEENSLIEIQLRRNRSYKIDNQVKGNLWIDGVFLVREPE